MFMWTGDDAGGLPAAEKLTENPERTAPQGQSAAGAEKPTQAVATIPPEVLAKMQADILKEAEKIAEAKGQQLLGAQRDRILRAMGNEPENSVDQAAVLKALLSNPVDVLTSVAERTRDITKRELLSDFAERDRAQTEDRQLATELLKDRPDIVSSSESIEMLNLLFDKTDEKKSRRERMTEAIRKHDLFMEKSGAGSKDERVKRVQKESASLPGGSSGAKANAKSGGDFYDRQKSAFDQYKTERQAQFKATHRGRKPIATLT
jgi:hypothetical protein